MAKQDEEIKINFEPVIAFFKNNKKVVQIGTITLLLIIALFFSVHFRSYSTTLPVAEQWAYDSITNVFKNQLRAEVNQQYPNLPDSRKNQIVNEQFSLAIAGEEDAIRAQAKQQAEFIKSQMQDDNGQTYLLAIDPYFYWRQTENVVDHGFGADELRDKGKWNTKVLAPIGRSENQTAYHQVISARIYNVVSIFNPTATVLGVFFWVPVIISSLGVIPAFFIARKKAGNLGGFVAAMLVGIHTTFIGRTAAGFSDTDAYNVTLPLFIFWFFIEAFEAKSLKQRIIFSVLAGFFTGVFARIWSGWWYIFDFMIVVMISYLGFSIIKKWIEEKSFAKGINNQETKNTGIITAITFLSSGIFVSLFFSFNAFITSPLIALKFTSIQDAVKGAQLWPNVFTTVAELNQASVNSIVTQIGGSIYFYLACLGVIITILPTKDFKNKDWSILATGVLFYLLLITRPFLRGNPYIYLATLLLPVAIGIVLLLKDKRSLDIKYAIFLTVWFAGTIYASTQGVRFILLLVPAYSVALGIFVGRVYQMLSNWSEKQFSIDQKWVKVTLILISLLLLVKPIQAAHLVALNEVPSMNDDWWATLDKIKQESDPDTIINSWWDFGHWFKAIANRAVTFDGGSQNTPMAHWIGKALLTDDEDQSLGILRMLNCGSREGFNTLSKHYQSSEAGITSEEFLQAKTVIDKLILIKDRQVAKEVLKEEGLTESESEEVLDLTHCQPPQSLVITSEDMVGKAGVWGHFGAWDFNRAYIFQELLSKQPQEAIAIISKMQGITEKEAGELYYEALSITSQDQANAWISPWPNYVTPRVVGCNNETSIIACRVNRGIGNQQGQRIVLETAITDLNDINKTAFIIAVYDSSTGQRLGEQTVKPSALVLGQDDLVRYPFAEAGFEYDFVLIREGARYRALIADKELSTSMFTRLFYFDGAFTEHFSKFSDVTTTLSGQRIIVWDVQWTQNKEPQTQAVQNDILSGLNLNVLPSQGFE